LRMTALPGRDGVADVRDGIRSARVLCHAIVVEIESSRLRIDRHVLEDRAEPSRRRVDLRLRLGGQSNRFRVTAAFEVEHPAVAPPMLIVANEPALGIARERRLTGS